MKKQILLLISILLFVAAIASAQTPPSKTISGGVLNGKAVTLAKPAYPAAAKAVRASGAVNVQVTIDEEGNVISASAVSGHPLLRQASEQAARTSKFTPTTLQGQPVKVTGVIVYNFIPPKGEAGNEQKLAIMGLSVFLTISDLTPTNEWKEIEKETLASVPQLADELAPITLITEKTSQEKRTETINKVIASVENKLSGADAWQFEFGKPFGEIMVELKKSMKTGDRLINETVVKTNLLQMKNLILTAPTDFPPDVLAKFKELTKFADVPDLNSDENKSRLMRIIIETLDIISPNR